MDLERTRGSEAADTWGTNQTSRLKSGRTQKAFGGARVVSASLRRSKHRGYGEDVYWVVTTSNPPHRSVSDMKSSRCHPTSASDVLISQDVPILVRWLASSTTSTDLRCTCEWSARGGMILDSVSRVTIAHP